jgi:hypothetical protein
MKRKREQISMTVDELLDVSESDEALAELLRRCTVELAERREVDASNYVARALACLAAARAEPR